MRRTTTSAVGIIALALAGGCSSSGLSPHEAGRQSYPMLMYTAAEPDAAPTGPTSIRTPARVAVAQVGEVAPPQAMVDGLRAHPELFRRVVPVSGTFVGPGGVDDGPTYWNGRAAAPADNGAKPTAADQLARMRSMAAGLGMDYLLVFGGTIEHGNQGSGLELLDLTIVGAFVVPSHGVTVTGRAAGSLIDVHTGQIVMDYSAEARGTGAAPSAFVDNVEETGVRANRDELVRKLTADVVAQTANEAKANAAR